MASGAHPTPTSARQEASGVRRTPGLARRWIKPSPHPSAEKLIAELKVHPLVAEILCQRGFIDLEDARQFLEPRLQNLSDPLLLTDLRKAAERILLAIEQKQKLVIYGDYDVDGITSSALLWRILTRLGANVGTFLPHRVDEGYGLSREGLERCLQVHRPALLIAVDCGTTSVNEVAWLHQQGVEVIVVDHHALPAELPKCEALVNPHRDGKWAYLASVGLVFKLCHGLLKVKGSRDIDLKEYLDLVAVGTVADIVPLVEENRILVKAGLARLEETTNVGLRELCRVAQIRGCPTPSDVGFRLGPRLNATGRLGDANRSLQLLKTDDELEARALAQELDASNRERQAIELATVQEAEEIVGSRFDPQNDWAIVVGKRGWHVGVIGIVASRLQREYHRPTFVIGFDEQGDGKGSGRSIEGCSLIDGLRASAAHLVQFGGHEMAAGLTLREESLAAFQSTFNKWVKSVLTHEHLQPRLHLSGEVMMSEVSDEIFYEIERMAPFGRENPQPTFIFPDVTQARPSTTFGRNHVKFFLKTKKGSCEAVAFGLAHRELPKDKFSMAGVLEWDDYRNQVQIRVMDWQ